MDSRLGERIAHSFITLLAFGVGLLIGPRFCASPQEASSARDSVLTSKVDALSKVSADAPEECEPCPECPAPQIVYQCPPEPEPPEPKGKGSRTKKKASLPEEPELDPLARKRLLAWVRDQSDVLKACRDDGQEIYRMAVIMRLDARTGKTKRVDVNASRGVVPGAVLSCVKQKVRSWQPPAELTQGRTQLVFGLTI